MKYGVLASPTISVEIDFCNVPWRDREGVLTRTPAKDLSTTQGLADLPSGLRYLYSISNARVVKKAEKFTCTEQGSNFHS